MNEIMELIMMGKYGAFVWSSVAISLLLIIMVFVYSKKRYSQIVRRAQNLELKDIY